MELYRRNIATLSISLVMEHVGQCSGLGNNIFSVEEPITLATLPKTNCDVSPFVYSG